MSAKQENLNTPASDAPLAAPLARDPAGREARLDSLLKNHVLAAMGLGLVPIPIVDLVGVTGVGLDLIRKLSDEYGVPFQQDRGKSILSALLAGVLPLAVGGVVMSLLKFVPIIGQTTGAVAMPVLFGAAIYAVHKVFVQHYAAGGTILDLDPSKVKAYFREQFFAGKSVAADIGKEAAGKSA